MSRSSPITEARKLTLPKPLHAPSPQISSFLYDPFSTSLALRHSDSSFSLYPSLTPLSLSSFPTTPKSLVPTPTSSAAFLHLRTTAAATITLFLTSSPILQPSSTLLRFYILRADRFIKLKAVSTHGDLEFDRARFGVVFGVSHGVSVRLSGGVNFFSLYSVSSCKIWVFAVRLIGDEEGGEALKLMKCAVIDCCLPVFTVRILFGFLVVGEDNGVRVFPLQLLVKGNHRKEKKNGGRRLKNGLTNGIDVAKGSNGGKIDGDLSMLSAKGDKREKQSDSVKSRSVKLRQDSRDVGAFFVNFEDKDLESSESTKTTRSSVKAISIEALSATYLVVLDSVGDVHLLCHSHSVQGLGNPCQMKRITQTMKVLKMAVFHDVSTVSQMQTQTIWISDGSYSVHLMMVSDMNTSFDKVEKKDNKDKLVQTSVTQAIFSSEKIRDIVPLAANAVLVLGQGNMFAYAIS